MNQRISRKGPLGRPCSTPAFPRPAKATADVRPAAPVRQLRAEGGRDENARFEAYGA